jgi:hypothetical protein
MHFSPLTDRSQLQQLKCAEIPEMRHKANIARTAAEQGIVVAITEALKAAHFGRFFAGNRLCGWS